MGGILGGGGGGGGDNSAAIKQQEKDLEMQRKENERLKAEAEAERRELGEQAAAKAKARRKGGFRMLLSQARMGAAQDQQGMQQKLGGDSQQVQENIMPYGPGTYGSKVGRPKKKKTMNGAVRQVMKEYKSGKLKSGSGAVVKSKDQAMAIAMAKSRKSA